MRRGLGVVVLILVLGYGLYGGLFVVGSAVHEQALTGDGAPDDASQTATDEGTNAPPKFNFTETAATASFDYEYVSEYEGNNQVMTNAGVYATDYNRDGWTDVLAVGGERPVLFENTGGEFRQSGVLPPLDSQFRAAHFLDYDSDGRPDLLLLDEGSPPVLLHNEGDEFVRVDAGFEEPLETPVGATSGDFDGDGHLDLYVAQYADWTERLPEGLEDYNTSMRGDNGNPNVLYDGNGTVFERNGTPEPNGARWSLAVSAADFTGDSRPEIHVANDFNNDVIYGVRDNGSYERTVLPERTNRNGMSSEVADVDDDGRLDVFVTNIYYPNWTASHFNEVLETKADGNNLLINDGNGGFTEKAEAYNVAKGGWGWAAVMTDFDNDGDEDLFHATRHLQWNQRAGGLSERQRGQLRRNDMYSYPVVWSRSDRGFDSVSPDAAGFSPANGRGVTRLDYDHDGTMDLVVATTDSYQLYENQGPAGNAVQIAVRNDDGGRALGASVYVRHDNGTEWRTIRPFTDYLSQDPGVVHVGVGASETVTVRVVWPDGTERIVTDVQANSRLTLGPDGVVDRTRLKRR